MKCKLASLANVVILCVLSVNCTHTKNCVTMRETMADLPEALPHGHIEQLGDDVFYVMGSNVIVFDGMRIQASRTMTVIRENKELTLINSIRLSDEGLNELAKLGRIKNVIRLGAFHGRDDAFYQRAFGAKLWAMPEMEKSHGEVFNNDLSKLQLPFLHGRVIAFKSTKYQEALLLIEKLGGILVSCDSIKNWQDQDPYFDDATFAMMKTLGSIGKARIDLTWLRAMRPSRQEIEALAHEKFSTLISAHGFPLTSDAQESVRASVSAVVGNL